MVFPSVADASFGQSVVMSVAALIHFIVPAFDILQGGDSGGGVWIWDGQLSGSSG